MNTFAHLMTIAVAAAVSAAPAPAAAGGDEAYDVSISRADAKKLVEAIAAAPSVGETAADEAAKDDGPISLTVNKKEDGPPPGTQNFAGLNFGVGISSTFDLGRNDRVTEAEVVAGLVRVTDQDNVRARIMLESHYFFVPRPDCSDRNTRHQKVKLAGLAANSCSQTEWGVGPFVALQPGTNEIIEAIGMGVMVGFKRSRDSSNSFNIGVGIVYDPNTRTLGPDIIDGQPLPAGETEIRYLEQDQVGLLVLSSFSF
ncbi:MAG: hypothetical protein HXY21_07875 [Parvularculaceae bacterium]|nr:hypothetical protein [Parvularculaceae bacterium]